jgi:hypothetical protein
MSITKKIEGINSKIGGLKVMKIAAYHGSLKICILLDEPKQFKVATLRMITKHNFLRKFAS